MDWEYNEKDVMLYALGLGCSRQETQYVYENDDAFAPLPTFAVLALHHGGLSNTDITQYVENFDPMLLLHGEQYVELYGSMPVAANVYVTSKVVSVQSKGKATLLVVGVTMKDKKSSRTLAYAEASIFLRGATPTKGLHIPERRNSDAKAQYSIPDRPADMTMEEKTSPDLAALYRLSGDWNPLHIDQEFASLAGFSDPILHGLATYGIGVKHVTKAFANGDPKLIKSMKARFVKHVFPGETLQTQMWKTADDTIVIQVKALERNVIVLNNAAVKLFHSAIMKRTSKL